VELQLAIDHRELPIEEETRRRRLRRRGGGKQGILGHGGGAQLRRTRKGMMLWRKLSAAAALARTCERCVCGVRGWRDETWRRGVQKRKFGRHPQICCEIL